MKNLGSKIFFLIVSVLILSCNKNDETATTPTNQNFFNLNVGNKWVYKKYVNSFDNPTQFTFSGIVDTIKIESLENIQGYTFAKKSSKKVNLNAGTIQPVTYSYVRINNAGHLIEILDDNNISNDFNYIYNHNIEINNGGVEILGNIEYKLYESLNKVIEGNNYLVLPYKGVFTPSDNHPELISKTVEYDYSQNIGLVRFICHYLNTNFSWEERLVEYQLN